MASIEESLRTLRDVEGVFGSFVISGVGVLVSKDLPAVFDDDVLSEVGPRITRLYETLASSGEELESVMLRYFEHKLYIRKIAWGLIGILSGIEVNLPSLRMVGNLVARRIDPEVAAQVGRAPAPQPRTLSRSQFAATLPTPTPPPPPPPITRTSAHPEPAAPAESERESLPPTSDRQVRMYRGRRIEE